MSFGKRQFGRCAALGIAAGVIALAGSARLGYAATLNQNLNIWGSAERTRPEMVAQASPTFTLVPGTAAPSTVKPTGKASKELPKGLNAPPPLEAVNKLLAPPQADPAVPLPRADLARQSPSGSDGSDSPMAGPHVYGRTEQGNNRVMGVVMGVKIPIPADHNSASPHTISGGGPAGSDSGDSGR
jgi:hypothetical protein